MRSQKFRLEAQLVAIWTLEQKEAGIVQSPDRSTGEYVSMSRKATDQDEAVDKQLPFATARQVVTSGYGGIYVQQTPISRNENYTAEDINEVGRRRF